LFLWGALSDDTTCLSSVYAAGPWQRSLSRARVLRSRDYIFLSQIWDFPFRRLLRLAVSQWRYLTPPPHGLWFTPRHRLSLCRFPTDHIEKTHFILVTYCCTCYPATNSLPRICLRGNLFIEPLPSSASQYNMHGRDENSVENFNPKFWREFQALWNT
jgi:hypothetical protein